MGSKGAAKRQGSEGLLGERESDCVGFQSCMGVHMAFPRRSHGGLWGPGGHVRMVWYVVDTTVFFVFCFFCFFFLHLWHVVDVSHAAALY
jgi:hypothetical protein